MLELDFTHFSREQVWSLLDKATDGVWFWDIQRDTVRWSAGLFRHLGYSKSGAAALVDVVAVTHPDDVPIQESAIADTLENGTPYDIRIRLQRSDGTYSWVDVRGVMEPDESGEPLFMLGYMVDVTAEQSALEALRLSERRFRSFMDNSPVAVVLRDPESFYRYANRKAAEIAGTSVEAMTGRSIGELFPAETAAELEALDAEVVERRDVHERMGEVKRSDGTSLWVHNVMFPVELEGEEVAVGGFGLDMSELREVQLRADAADRLRSLGGMAGGIAHDFNNMLGVILGFTQMVRDRLDEDSEDHELLGEVVKAADRSAELTRQLLGFARRQTIQPESLDLVACLKDSTRLLRKLIGENIELRIETAGSTEFVSLDRSQVDQILTNLCANARDAIGGIGTIGIRLEGGVARPGEHGDETAPRPGVLLSVLDSGTGMSEKVRSRIFEPFFTTKPVGEGNGLGLSTVYGIVQQNGGEIDVESSPGNGTAVHIWFPRALASPLPKRTRRTAPPADGGRRVVAVVEDEPALLRLTCRALEGIGYEVLGFEGPEQALEHLPPGTVSLELVVTDVVMPKMSGPDLVRALRERFPALPAVFVSGYTHGTEGAELDLDSTAVFLPKPFSIEELGVAIEETLSK